MNIYGLIGYPLTHSFSKKYFSQKFEDEGISNSKYELFEIKNVEDFPALFQNHLQLRGLNVTIPHKESVIQFLDEVDPSVLKIKAVNVIKKENGKLKGYNSDYYGFKQSLINFFNQAVAFETADVVKAADISKIKALVLGTGGASKAVKAALQDLGIPYKTVSRTAGQADFTYEDLNDQLQNYHLIINTTPLGMYPKTDTCPELPYSKLTSSHYLFDLVYNPEETLFMKKGKEQGARTKNGLEMLYLQAEKAWEIWNS